MKMIILFRSRVPKTEFDSGDFRKPNIASQDGRQADNSE